MKILFIGGTGNISTYCVEQAVNDGHQVYVVNRGKRNTKLPPQVTTLTCDIRNEQEAAAILEGIYFDVVADFVAFVREHIEEDLRLFSGKCGQFIFISTATVYNKPPTSFPVTESTPLKNPYWKYSRDKIVCEELLMNAYREQGFPVTILRPSHTYGKTMIPGIFGHGDFTEIARIKAGKKVIVQGDGQTLWTLTHASDFAKGFAGLCGNFAAIGESFHITSDEHLTWDRIMLIKAQAVGCSAGIIHIPSDFIHAIDSDTGVGLLGDKQYNAIFDNSKLKKFVPGFQATMPFSKGLQDCIDYFTQDESRCRENDLISSLIDRIIAAYQGRNEV